MFWRYLLLFLGILACSTSAIMIKASHTQPFVLAALRLLIATTFLLPVLRRELARPGGAFSFAHYRRTWLPGSVLGLHLITWTVGARITATAQASLIVNLVPIAVPFFLHWLARERINRTEIAGTALALCGLVALTAKNAFSGGGNAWGNLVCFVSMLLFALYLALSRRNRDFPSLWLYVIPVYGQAALVCLVFALPWVHTFAFGSAREWALMFGLAFIPTLLGHSLLNASMRHLRGQIVGLCNVSQFIFAGIMAFFFFGEIPKPIFYAASVLVVAGVATVVIGRQAVEQNS